MTPIQHLAAFYALLGDEVSPRGLAQVTDRVFLSDGFYRSSDLSEHGITHILSIGAGYPWAPADTNVSRLYLDVADEAREPIHQVWSKAFAYIDSAPRVLVHCTAGISRSPTIVIAYLMSKGMPLSVAVRTTVRARPEAKPNSGFVRALINYANELNLNDLI